MKFEFAADGGLDREGNPTGAYGFVARGFFVFDPYASTCGRLRVDPRKAYGLSEDDAMELVRLNERMGVSLPQGSTDA